MREELPLIILIALVIFFWGICVGCNMSLDVTRKEIDQYNSIRIDGVYYYPERTKGE